MLSKKTIKSWKLSWWLRSVISRARLNKQLKSVTIRDNSKLELQANKKVLIFSSVSLFTDHVLVEYLLAKKFKELGAEVKVVLCERDIPICHAHDRYSCGFPIKNIKVMNVCNSCIKSREVILQWLKKAEILPLSFEGAGQIDLSDEVEIDEQVNAGVIRYLATSSTDQSADFVELKSNYKNSSAYLRASVNQLLDREKPDVVIGHHGIYVPQGIINDLCQKKHINFYSWHFGYRKSTLIFSKSNTYHKELGTARPRFNINSSQREKIHSYLGHRRTGSADWIHFNRNPSQYPITIRKRTTICFFSSVDWDAALHFKENVYSSQFDFISEFLKIVKVMDDYDFVIRVHPAEKSGFHPSFNSLEDFIKKEIPDGLSNLLVVSADDPKSSYDLSDQIDVAVVYNTKMSIELTCAGIPTIVAGEAWVRGRGFTFDVNSREDLFALLKMSNTLQMSNVQIEAALNFAYYFYFVRCIDVPQLRSTGKKFKIEFEPGCIDADDALSQIVTQIIAGRAEIVG